MLQFGVVSLRLAVFLWLALEFVVLCAMRDKVLLHPPFRKKGWLLWRVGCFAVLWDLWVEKTLGFIEGWGVLGRSFNPSLDLAFLFGCWCLKYLVITP